MISLFLATENLPFSIALVLMFGIALLEGVSVIIGVGFSQILEGLLPDFDAPEIDMPEADTGVECADMQAPSVMTRFLGWVKVRDVPMLVVLVVFLTLFSLIGFALQSFVRSFFAVYLPWYIAVWPALFLTVPLVRGCSLLLSRFVIKDETTAVSPKSFIGRPAVITVGTARVGLPAQAKLKDQYGQTHYVMVEPESANDEFEQSTSVLLVNREKSIFKAIETPSSLIDSQERMDS